MPANSSAATAPLLCLATTFLSIGHVLFGCSRTNLHHIPVDSEGGRRMLNRPMRQGGDLPMTASPAARARRHLPPAEPLGRARKRARSATRKAILVDNPARLYQF